MDRTTANRTRDGATCTFAPWTATANDVPRCTTTTTRVDQPHRDVHMNA